MTLEILTSDALSPLRHGFFTRHGGASSGIFAGLNCGRGSSDLAEIVAINRDRAAQAVGVNSSQLASLNQIHSAEAVTLRDYTEDGSTADALVTDQPGFALSVLTADCAPVLFADHDAAVIGAAHAGWRGALSGILDATIDAMEALGARRDQIVAAVGPTISQANYEVGPEFLETFLDEDPEASRYFAQGVGDRVQFDLPGFVLGRLRRAEIGHAEWTRHCTYRDPDRFYSYRRSVHQGEADYGRLISIIRL